MYNDSRYLDPNLLVHAGLLFLDLLLKSLQRSGIWGRSIGFEHLNIPGNYQGLIM
jgi:hypothetical protein